MRIKIDVNSEVEEDFKKHIEEGFGNNIEIIDEYEPLEQISKKVERMVDIVKEIENGKVNWNIFNYYLRGRGLSQREIDTMREGVEQFIKDLGVK